MELHKKNIMAKNELEKYLEFYGNNYGELSIPKDTNYLLKDKGYDSVLVLEKKNNTQYNYYTFRFKTASIVEEAKKIN